MTETQGVRCTGNFVLQPLPAVAVECLTSFYQLVEDHENKAS
jgi:hypothetical protein